MFFPIQKEPSIELLLVFVFKCLWKYPLDGDYVIPVYPYKKPSNRDRFQPMITLGYQISSRQGGPVFNLVFVQICLHFLSSFLFGPNRLHGTISSRQSGIPTVQKRYPALSRKTYVVVGYNLRRILVLPGSQKNRTEF